jgi:Skp family chaperone for outer membrane proteins
LQQDLEQHAQELAAVQSQQPQVQAQLETARQEHEALLRERGRRQQEVEAVGRRLQQREQQLADEQQAAQSLHKEIVARSTQGFQLGALRPLSAEQLCMAVFQVTGVHASYRQAEIAELDKAAPLSEADREDPAKVAAREREIEQRVYDKLFKPYFGTFASLYAAGAGQPQGDFFASADQALYALNGGGIQSWAAASGVNVTGRLLTATDAAAAAEDLFLTVFTRRPTAEEIAYVQEHLARRPDDRAAAAQELVWGLLTSVEFRFNH